MKKLFMPVLLLLAACQSGQHPIHTYSDTVANTANDTIISEAAAPQPAIPFDRLIIPGESLGQTPLGLSASLLEKRLGAPDLSDAAMGKAWLTWNGKKDEHNNKTELNIYTTYADTSMREKVVRQIRTTSSWFKTKTGVGVYSSLQDIRAQWPDIKKAGAYQDDGRTIEIYDSKANGIAFEIARANEQEICTGIIIHPKGKEVLSEYLYLHPDMKRYE